MFKPLKYILVLALIFFSLFGSLQDVQAVKWKTIRTAVIFGFLVTILTNTPVATASVTRQDWIPPADCLSGGLDSRIRCYQYSYDPDLDKKLKEACYDEEEGSYVVMEDSLTGEQLSKEDTKKYFESYKKAKTKT